MARPTVLILGAGIAGPALAYWLARHGFQPTVVERSTELRSGGTPVVIKGPAAAVADKMGVMPQLREVATQVTTLCVLDPGARQIARLPLTSDDAPSIEVTRADLSTVLYGAASDDAEFVFDNTVTGLEQDRAGVDVTFRRGTPRRFDLVIGADGVHSTVRRLAFGPERDFTKPLGIYSANVPLPLDTEVDPHTMVVLNTPGRMLAIHPSRETPLAIFTFRDSGKYQYDRRDIDLHKRIVADAFAGMDWRAAEMVAAYEAHPDPFLDPLANVRVRGWSRGRVALLGDASSAAALLSDGSSLAIAGAYALTEALAAHPGDHLRAFRAYEQTHRSEGDKRLRRVGALAALLIPRTSAGLAMRNTVGRVVGRVVRPAPGAAATSRIQPAGADVQRLP